MLLIYIRLRREKKQKGLTAGLFNSKWAVRCLTETCAANKRKEDADEDFEKQDGLCFASE